MYRLMVVEDEEMIRQGIVKSIPWESLGYEVVTDCKNGKIALEMLKKIPVDVLLTDIKMPVMDGIELSKVARKLYPNIEIIILSGFSDFEYARQAISFRAFDYLLKPTNRQKLLASFESLRETMDQKKERKEEMYINNAYKNAGYEILRNDFLLRLLEGDVSVFQDFEEKIASLELDLSGDCYIASTIKFDRKTIFTELESTWETDKRLLTFSYSNIITEALSHIDNAYYVVADYDVIHFIFCFSDQIKYQDLMYACLDQISENIQNCLFRQVQVPYRVGVGLNYPSIHHIAKSFNQAKNAVLNDFYSGDQIYVYQNTPESSYEQNFIQNHPEEMKHIANAVSQGDVFNTKHYVKGMFQRLSAYKMMSEIVKNYCISLKFIVQSKILIRDDMIDERLGERYNEFVRDALSVHDLEIVVQDTMVSIAQKVEESIEEFLPSEQSLLIERAKKYMKNHLGDKINLNMICEHVFLSGTYFSFLFKKVTGMTYIDYMQELRMQEAKRLLVTTSLKVYEIAEKIGYSDYKYFSVQFRKHVMMTPKTYRLKARIEGDDK